MLYTALVFLHLGIQFDYVSFILKYWLSPYILSKNTYISELFCVGFKLKHKLSRHIWGYTVWLILNSLAVWSTELMDSKYLPISETESRFLFSTFTLCYGKTVTPFLTMTDSCFKFSFTFKTNKALLIFYKFRTHLEVL